MQLPIDIQWYIYKCYFSSHILCDLKTQAEKYKTVYYFKHKVFSELLLHSIGNYISYLINKFIKENPRDLRVREFDMFDWDRYFYNLYEAHTSKTLDIFLFHSLIDAIQVVHA